MVFSELTAVERDHCDRRRGGSKAWQLLALDDQVRFQPAQSTSQTLRRRLIGRRCADASSYWFARPERLNQPDWDGQR
jgi:hypothetical protein